MSYIRFGLMILTSTVVMFVLMYLNTYAWEHVFFSETRTYMAIMMGATMAVIMLAYMLGMYSNKRLNIAIFAGSVIVFALSLWLVRSQVTVSGPSYMRAMIPHHSIAVMTSERAQIRDPRVRKLADEIIAAQRREIAEMRYLIAEVSEGNVVESIYQDPPAEPGSVEDALSNTLISTLDPAPIPEAEAEPGSWLHRSLHLQSQPGNRPDPLGERGGCCGHEAEWRSYCSRGGRRPAAGRCDVQGARHVDHGAAARRRGGLAPERGTGVRA